MFAAGSEPEQGWAGAGGIRGTRSGRCLSALQRVRRAPSSQVPPKGGYPSRNTDHGNEGKIRDRFNERSITHPVMIER